MTRQLLTPMCGIPFSAVRPLALLRRSRQQSPCFGRKAAACQCAGAAVNRSYRWSAANVSAVLCCCCAAVYLACMLLFLSSLCRHSVGTLCSHIYIYIYHKVLLERFCFRLLGVGGFYAEFYNASRIFWQSAGVTTSENLIMALLLKCRSWWFFRVIFKRLARRLSRLFRFLWWHCRGLLVRATSLCIESSHLLSPCPTVVFAYQQRCDLTARHL